MRNPEQFSGEEAEEKELPVEGFMPRIAALAKRPPFGPRILAALGALTLGTMKLEKAEATDPRILKNEGAIATRTLDHVLETDGDLRDSDSVMDLVEQNNPEGIARYLAETSDQNVAALLTESITEQLETVSLGDAKGEAASLLVEKAKVDFEALTGASLAKLLQKENAKMTTDGKPGLLDKDASVDDLRRQIIDSYLAKNPVTDRSLHEWAMLLGEADPQVEANFKLVRTLVDEETIRAAIAAERNQF